MVASTGPATTVLRVSAGVVYVSAPGPVWIVRSSCVQGLPAGTPPSSAANVRPPALHCSVPKLQGLLAPVNSTWSAPVAALGAVVVSRPSFCEGAPLLLDALSR